VRFAIVVKKDRQTVTMNRNSFLIAIAKARVWASEGWDVTIVDNENAAAVIEHFPTRASERGGRVSWHGQAPARY
jgi:hypothetical protein